ncbi:vesicular glutamate transporter 3-like [Branchiostoma floridae]|uniref:Vesicular glutamate transporter 3-like n=1 Tax=Branchiostoma floridae TaxID=7739 RepID=A0A9J7MEM2_BRAFL|nr:vesicular glutamate transporter 3-like [Branchiostoma floridae]
MDTSKPDMGKITKTKSIPFRHILTSPAVWAFILLQVAAYVWDPNLLPLYFNQSFGTKIELTGVLAGVPILIFGAIEPLFALLGNLLCKYVSTTVARKVMAVTACLCVSGCLFTAAFTSNPVVAACFVAVGFGCSAARAAVADCNLFDIVPRYVSVIEGICRVTCRIVGLTFPLLATALTPHKTLQEWSRVVLIKACVFAATGLIFLVFGSGEEQSWAAVPLQGHDGDDIQQDGSNKKLNDEKIPLVVK